MTRSRTTGPTQRQLRVGEEVRHILVEILRRVTPADSVLEKASITVSEVRMSPDLKFAKIYIMPMGGKDQDIIIKALNKLAPTYRYALGQELNNKFTPSLQFRVDETFDEASKIEALLRSEHVQQDLKKDIKEGIENS